MRLLLSRLLQLPWLTIGCVLLLSLIGALALYSASQGAWSPWAERHIVRAGAGVVMMVMILIVPIRYIYQSSY